MLEIFRKNSRDYPLIHLPNTLYMRNLIITVFLLFYFDVGFAFTANQEQGAGILWRVSGNGLKSDSYILGTAHDVPVSFLDSLKGFSKIWAQVTQVVTETETANILDSLQNGHFAILKKFNTKTVKPIAYPLPNMKYKDLYTESQLAFMDSILNPFVISGMKVADKSPLQLWYQYNNLKQFSLKNKSQDKVSVKNPLDFFKNAMDAMLERRCKAEGKRHVKLEDFFAATDALDKADVLADSSFNLHEQADILYQCMLYEAKSKDKLHVDKLENAYQDKNFAKYSDGYMHQHDYINSLNLTSTLKEKLFQYEKKRIEIIGENRTLNWMNKILAEINAAPTLVAVGIDHLIGEKGLIHLLRQYGYTIEPVK